jgi:sorbitol-specific phosphotransferase system component IIA
MKRRIRSFLKSTFVLVFATAVVADLSPYNLIYTQGRQEPGRSIGTVTTHGNLIVMTLNDGTLGHANLFDLARRTLRFTPENVGYRAENLPLQWDREFGAEITNPQVTLHNFAFPFSGKSWDSLSVGTTGSVSFGPPPSNPGGPGGGSGGRGGGVSIARFDQLQQAARTLINTVPAICIFFKPRMSGTRYVKELADRVVITWSLTEPFGNIQDFT